MHVCVCVCVCVYLKLNVCIHCCLFSSMQWNGQNDAKDSHSTIFSKWVRKVILHPSLGCVSLPDLHLLAANGGL